MSKLQHGHGLSLPIMAMTASAAVYPSCATSLLGSWLHHVLTHNMHGGWHTSEGHNSHLHQGPTDHGEFVYFNTVR